MTPRFVRKLSCQYTRTLQPSALRDAILGYIGYSFPGGVFRIKCDDYLLRAKRALGRQLIAPASVEESDFFASFFLCGSLPRARESIRHYDGCIKLYRYLLHRPNASPFFRVYGRFGLDQVTQWMNRELVLGTGISPHPVQIVWPSFQRMCEDYSHLSSPKWPSLDMAALDICYNILYLLEWLLKRRISGATSNYLEGFPVPQSVMQGIMNRFYDIKLQNYLHIADAICCRAQQTQKLTEYLTLVRVVCMSWSIRMLMRVVTSTKRSVIFAEFRSPSPRVQGCSLFTAF